MQRCTVAHRAHSSGSVAHAAQNKLLTAAAALQQQRQRQQRQTLATRASFKAAGPGKLYIDPVEKEVAAFAPATVANLGPGFDWMGCAVEARRPCRGCCSADGAAAAATSAAALPSNQCQPLLGRSQGDGDVVTARVLPDRPGEVVIEGIEGDGGRLSLQARWERGAGAGVLLLFFAFPAAAGATTV